MPLTAPRLPRSAPAVRGRPRWSAAAEHRARAQGAEHDPAERPAAANPLLGSEPAEDPQHACEHRGVPSGPTNASGSTSPESQSRTSTSTAPRPPRWPLPVPAGSQDVGGWPAANRRVRPPVGQNRARRSARRALPRPLPRRPPRGPGRPATQRRGTSTARSPAGSSHPCLPCRARSGSGGPVCVVIEPPRDPLLDAETRGHHVAQTTIGPLVRSTMVQE